MKDNPLQVISSPSERKAPTRTNRMEEARAKFERLWLTDPEQFNPNRSAIERERIERTWSLLKPLLKKPDLKVLDIGFGWGVLADRIHQAHTEVDGVEIASNAIKHFESLYGNRIRLIRDAAPDTSLPNSHYDLVICTDLIAELHSHDQRLLISELYRLIKPDGHILLSTGFDVDTDGAFERFQALVETELSIAQAKLSAHTYYLNLLRGLGLSARYLKARNDASYRQLQLNKRSGWGRTWFNLQLQYPLYAFWWTLNILTAPLARRLTQSRWMLLQLEKVCHTLDPQEGISHAIVVAIRKPLEESAESAESHMSPPTQRLRERIWE